MRDKQSTLISMIMIYCSNLLYIYPSSAVIFLAWKSLTQPTHGLPSGLFGRPHVTSNTPHKPSVHPNTYHNLNIAHSISAAVSVASSTNTSVRSHGAYISETESESETATPRGTLSRADSTHSVDSVSTMNSEEPSALMFGANRRHVPSLGVVGGVGSMSLDGNQSQPGSAANSARDENGNRCVSHCLANIYVQFYCVVAQFVSLV